MLALLIVSHWRSYTYCMFLMQLVFILLTLLLFIVASDSFSREFFNCICEALHPIIWGFVLSLPKAVFIAFPFPSSMMLPV